VTAPPDLLDAARSGDADAFEELVAPLRGELLAHCYRMLGSMHDAEDAVQESLVRAWRGVGGLDERGFVRAWLYKIATNRCLTAVEQRGRRELPVDVLPGTPDTEISWLEPYPHASPETQYVARESVDLAFVAAVNSAMQRARKVVGEAGASQQSVLRELGPDGIDDIVTRWATAWHASDIDTIVAMLTEDARYSMPPLPEWYRGTAEIRTFLLGGPLQSRWRFLPTSANGQLAFGTYLWDDDTNAYLPGGLDVLTIQDGRISDVVAFLAADLTEFGLPATLPAP
jgi:DNA-directed RNA polymerase specialized sigma24 family protein